MRPQLTIAIDFDDTFTADVEFWTKMIELAQRYGHQVICVSARHDDDYHRQQLTDSLPDGVPVLLSELHPKYDYAKDHGYSVDIWIDDVPEAIGSTLKLPGYQS